MDPDGKRYVLSMAMEDPMESEQPPTGAVERTMVGAIGLKAGQAFGYWFDFGDDWWHQVNVVSISEAAPPGPIPR